MGRKKDFDGYVLKRPDGKLDVRTFTTHHIDTKHYAIRYGAARGVCYGDPWRYARTKGFRIVRVKLSEVE